MNLNFKWVLESKTMWLNLVALVLAVLALPEFISIIPATWLPLIGTVTSVLNILLRMGGGQPLSLAKPLK